MTVNAGLGDLPEFLDEEAAVALLATDRRTLRRAIRTGHVSPPNKAGFPTVALVGGWLGYLRSGEIAAETAGELLGLSAQRIGQLVAAGHIQRNERGAITRQSALRGYGRYLANARAQGETAEAARWQDAKTRKVEMELTILDERMIETAEACAAAEGIVAVLVEELMKVPDQFRDWPGLQQKLRSAANAMSAQTYSKLREEFGDSK